MSRYVFIVLAFFCAINLYAANCELLDSENGYIGLLEIECDEEISLTDNKAVFYITGKNVDIDSIETSRGQAEFDVDEISSRVQRVSVNLSVQGWIDDSDYIAYKDQPVDLVIKIKRDSNPDYQLLWGGVIKNSFKNLKNKNNNLQFFRNKSGKFTVSEDGLECSIKNDCDDISLLKSCEAEECKSLRKQLNIYSDFGLVHQRNI